MPQRWCCIVPGSLLFSEGICLRGTREAYEFYMNSHREQTVRKGFTHTCKTGFRGQREMEGQWTRRTRLNQGNKAALCPSCHLLLGRLTKLSPAGGGNGHDIDKYKSTGQFIVTLSARPEPLLCKGAKGKRVTGRMPFGVAYTHHRQQLWGAFALTSRCRRVRVCELIWTPAGGNCCTRLHLKKFDSLEIERNTTQRKLSKNIVLKLRTFVLKNRVSTFWYQ